MDKKSSINKYTEAGRAEIHKKLEYVDVNALHYLMLHPVNGSIEYNDNRLSLYSAQRGKCAILHQPMEFDRIHCHHIIPKSQGGSDKYRNLLLVDKDVHALIHATVEDTIQKYLSILQLSAKQLEKVNQLREKAGLQPI